MIFTNGHEFWSYGRQSDGFFDSEYLCGFVRNHFRFYFSFDYSVIWLESTNFEGLDIYISSK